MGEEEPTRRHRVGDALRGRAKPSEQGRPAWIGVKAVEVRSVTFTSDVPGLRMRQARSSLWKAFLASPRIP
jgi:hypothetical protein